MTVTSVLSGRPHRGTGLLLVLGIGLWICPAAVHADKAARVSRLITQGDAIYVKNQSPASTWSAIGFYREALKLKPRSHGALWRTARAFARLADHSRSGPEGHGGALGKRGYDYAFLAIQAAPRRVEGYYWAALCVGEWGKGMGMVTALRKGIGGKFLRYLMSALRIDPAYDDGGPYRVLGMYHHSLPWPMKSNSKALRQLRRSLSYSPGYGITHALLAQVLLDEGRRAEARKHLQACVRASARGHHPQIIRRYQRQCKKQLGFVKK